MLSIDPSVLQILSSNTFGDVVAFEQCPHAGVWDNCTWAVHQGYEIRARRLQSLSGQPSLNVVFIINSRGESLLAGGWYTMGDDNDAIPNSGFLDDQMQKVMEEVLTTGRRLAMRHIKQMSAWKWWLLFLAAGAMLGVIAEYLFVGYSLFTWSTVLFAVIGWPLSQFIAKLRLARNWDTSESTKPIDRLRLQLMPVEEETG